MTTQNNFKNIDSLTKIQQISSNLISKDSHIFSAFSKNKLKKHLIDVHDDKYEQFENLNQMPFKFQQKNNNVSIFGKCQKHSQLFEGLLKSRKSKIRKIKLKQFYLEDQQSSKKDILDNNLGGNVDAKSSETQNPTQFNTIQSTYSEDPTGYKPLYFLPSRKRVLPVRLRARSYSIIPKNSKQSCVQMAQNQISLYIKAKMNKNSCKQRKQSANNLTVNQNSNNENNCRKSIKSGNRRKINNFQDQDITILVDISGKANEKSFEINKNDKKTQKQFRRTIKQDKKLIQINKLSKQEPIEINPWISNYNQDGKQNQIFID